MEPRIEPVEAGSSLNEPEVPFAGTVDTAYMDIPKVAVVRKTEVIQVA
ncbi:hypothetical protein [Methanomethylovorans sp.]